MVTHYSWYFKISVIKQKGTFAACMASALPTTSIVALAMDTLQLYTHNLSQLNLTTEKMVAIQVQGQAYLYSCREHACAMQRGLLNGSQRKVINTALKQYAKTSSYMTQYSDSI